MENQRMFAYLRSLFGSSTDSKTLGGADAVFDAITERTDMGYSIHITLGEPELVDRGTLTEDLFVVIPTSTDHGVDPANLEYDLPDGMEDATAEFYDLLNAFGIEKIADVFDLDGKTVPATRENGTPVPAFDELNNE